MTNSWSRLCGKLQSATGFWSQLSRAGESTGDIRYDASFSSVSEVDEELVRWSAKIAPGEDRRGMCSM